MVDPAARLTGYRRVMIKRILLVTRGCAPDDFVPAWRAAMGAAAAAPPDVRPSRVTAGIVLDEVTPEPRHDAVGQEWFDDEEHLKRFESWLTSPEGAVVDELLGRAVERDASGIVVAREHVMRGEEWLSRRRRDGGESLKHMALATRAAGLTQAEFFDRWRNRAGLVGAVPIPPVARGQAYMQNHPLPRDVGDWPYDAVNEVYFDNLDDLRARIAWFAENLAGNEDDLVRESWFVTVREEVLWPDPAA
ncbi:EthD domain-containing protein [Parafrankia sp. Ea1.12]|uniref:EthD domain-containing protein n=1 Tax=Parafrankia sp. Ea1.12 TaxID=573499 RepID=UPI001F275ABF|nr:EthD domain-containing protein [Parafrankia sp. Ea1.12]